MTGIQSNIYDRKSGLLWHFFERAAACAECFKFYLSRNMNVVGRECLNEVYMVPNCFTLVDIVWSSLFLFAT